MMQWKEHKWDLGAASMPEEKHWIYIWNWFDKKKEPI